jgi:acyl dehydratase
MFAAVLEDGNPSYWDEDFATETWGGLLMPPGMLQSWPLPLPWTPAGGKGELRNIATEVPLPGDKPINVSTDVRFFVPVRAGDRLRQTATLESLSAGTRTRLGPGHFLVVRSDYRNQNGTLVASASNTLLRYRVEAPSESAGTANARPPSMPVRREAQDREAVERLPAVTLEITHTRAIQHVAASRDYMRGHHDVAFARSQGQPTIFLNTNFHQGLVDRVVTDWAGPRSFIVRRKLQMTGSVLVGDIVRAQGEVDAEASAEAQDGERVVSVRVMTGNGACSRAEVTVRLGPCHCGT